MLFLTLLKFTLLLSQPNSLGMTFNEQLDVIDARPELRAEIITDLKNELARRTKTLKRSIKVYHYGQRASEEPLSETIYLKRNDSLLSPVELNPPEASNYFRRMADSFRSSEKIQYQVGPGLYAAIDPVQSQAYANTPWFLLEITMPSGTRYLDTRPNDGILLSKAFVQKWFSNLFANHSDNEDVIRFGKDRFFIKFTKLLRLAKLRQLVVEALERDHTYVIAYYWAESTISICRDRLFRSSAAFNFINPAFLTRNSLLKLYTQNLEENPSDEKKNAYSRLLDKIESSELRKSLQLNAEGTSYLPSVKTWVDSSKIQLLTLSWSRNLRRKSLLQSALFKDPNIEQHFIKYDESTVDDADIIPTLFEKNLKIEIEPETSSSFLNKYLYFDPLNYLKMHQPAEYQRRLKMIEDETFGCSSDPRYEDEQTPPEL